MELMVQQQVNDSGFESVPTPPKNGHLDAFVEDLYDLVRNVEFKRANMVFKISLIEILI